MAATIKQVAARAGVSTATVSYVLNGVGQVGDETRQRVQAAAADLAYEPRHAARSLRGRSWTLGLALGSAPGQLASPAVAAMLDGIATAAGDLGYGLLLLPAAPGVDPVERCLSMARSQRVDGLIVFDPLTDDPRALALAAAGVPHVCAGPAPAGSIGVAVQTQTAARQAVQHLLGLGHRTIALIQLPGELAESEPRYLGYAEALAAHGVPLDAALIVEAGLTEEDGYRAADELLADAAPTAILACNGELAVGALHALYDARLTPGRECSLIGFDDEPLAAHTQPPLTCIRQPHRAVGERLVIALDDIINRRTARSVSLPAQLIVRKSTGVFEKDVVFRSTEE